LSNLLGPLTVFIYVSYAGHLKEKVEGFPKDMGWLAIVYIVTSTRSTRNDAKGVSTMAQWRPDPTFYPSPRMAMRAPGEQIAYVAAINPTGKGEPDALLTIDVNPSSAEFGKEVARLAMPNAGDELHHFGWNACSSCLCPYAPHPHVGGRYLFLPGLRSSRIHIIDTKEA